MKEINDNQKSIFHGLGVMGVVFLMVLGVAIGAKNPAAGKGDFALRLDHQDISMAEHLEREASGISAGNAIGRLGG